MTDSPADIFEALAAPFPPDRVSWRIGSTNRKNFEAGKAQARKGKPLCYIDARDVMDRLDEVMGPHWQTKPNPLPNGTVACEIGLLIEGDWIWRGDGAGATDVEGVKGAFSDALKRAAVLWGVGRYLYGIDARYIELDEWWGIPKDAYAGLRALLERNGAPAKSAYQARKDGDDKAYREIETALRLAGSVSGDKLKEVWATHWPAIQQWPDVWREKITEEKDRLKGMIAQQAKPKGKAKAKEAVA
jgi:hypothetical protein